MFKNSAKNGLATLVIGLIAVGAVTTACSIDGAENTAATVSATTTATSSATPHTTTRQSYSPPSTASSSGKYGDALSNRAMKTVIENEGINASSEFLDDYAQVVCEGLADGIDPMEIAFIAYESLPQYDLMEHAAMIGASVGTYCEEFGYIIDAL